MAGGANLDPETLAGFRAALVKFNQVATRALRKAEADVQSTLKWLEEEREKQNHKRLR